MSQPPSLSVLRRVIGCVLIAALPLAGCGLFEDDETLQGERVPVRALTDDTATVNVVPAPLPPARTLDAWTQVGSTASHNGGHLAGPVSLNEVWRQSAGQGSSDDSRVTAGPVVAGGTVYTLDAAARVSAFDAGSGAPRWQTSLTPSADSDGEEGFGGGLAVADGRLYAATGFGEVLELSAQSGEIGWRTSAGAPFRAAPAVSAGRVVAVTRASLAITLNQSDGSVVWRSQGVTADAGYLGGASPAISGNAALVPFPSGELVAFDLGSGRRAWSAVLTGGRRGLARSAITDLTGDPVIVGPLVISANQSGRIVAIEGRTGQRVWTRALGSTAPIWAAGDTLFVISDTETLMRLDARTGQTLWERKLPSFEDEEDREDPITYSGPVVVSGRVLLTDSLGNIWSWDAVTADGGVAGEIPGGSVTGPVVAGGTLYILSDDAVLHAYR